MEPTAAPSRGPSFARLVHDIGPVIELVVEGGGEPIETVGLHDPADPLAGAADLVILVGAPAEGPAGAALQGIAEAGAKAVLVRPAFGAALKEPAAARGLGLGLVDPNLQWLVLLDLLRGLIVAHDDAAELVSAFGSLFSLADQAAAATGGAITVEDSRGRILAYSTQGHAIDEARRLAILERSVPPGWRRSRDVEGAYAALRQGPDPVHLEPDPAAGLRRRVAAGLHAGSRFLGTVWLVEGDEPLTEDAEERLVKAAEPITLHLVRHRTEDDLTARRRGEVFRLLLDGRISAAVAARHLDLPPLGDFVAVACRAGLPGTADAVVSLQRLVQTMQMLAATQRRRMTAAITGDTAQCLMPFPDGVGSLSSVRDFWTDLVTRCEQDLGVKLTVAIGKVVRGLSAVASSAEEADRILAAVAPGMDRARQASGQVFTIEDVRAAVVTQTVGERMADDPVWRVPDVDRLASLDAAHGTEYVPTLRAWFRSGCDASAAAQTLGVHPNTLRHRLGRIKERGLDLDDPDTRFLADLHLRIEPLGGPDSKV